MIFVHYIPRHTKENTIETQKTIDTVMDKRKFQNWYTMNFVYYVYLQN